MGLSSILQREDPVSPLRIHGTRRHLRFQATQVSEPRTPDVETTGGPEFASFHASFDPGLRNQARGLLELN